LVVVVVGVREQGARDGGGGIASAVAVVAVVVAIPRAGAPSSRRTLERRARSGARRGSNARSSKRTRNAVVIVGERERVPGAQRRR